MAGIPPSGAPSACSTTRSTSTRDALDAYSRAIRLNPFISEVWYDLGHPGKLSLLSPLALSALPRVFHLCHLRHAGLLFLTRASPPSQYESCNNQISDALDAYSARAELDPQNPPHQGPACSCSATAPPTASAARPCPHRRGTRRPTRRGAVGPPGPQWPARVLSSSPPPTGRRRAPPANGWRRASRTSTTQPPNPYDQRDAFRGGSPTPPCARQPSPRQEQQLRPYGDPHPPGPAAPRSPEARPVSAAAAGSLFPDAAALAALGAARQQDSEPPTTPAPPRPPPTSPTAAP